MTAKLLMCQNWDQKALKVFIYFSSFSLSKFLWAIEQIHLKDRPLLITNVDHLISKNVVTMNLQQRKY